jgi:hypothetical protein
MIRDETHALSHNEALRKLLHDEQTWLLHAEHTIASIRHHREWEVHRFWPAVWRRWAVAAAFVLLTAAATGAGYVWSPGRTRPSLRLFARGTNSWTLSRIGSS